MKRVLTLIMEAMRAQSAALLLYNPRTAALDATAAVGTGDGELERYTTSLDPSSFAGQTAASEESTSVFDIATTELAVSDGLRQNGVHSLLGIRLPPRHRLVGVLYVGVSETREFTAREVRRLESLGQHLTLQLDNARLYSELVQQVDALQAERQLREQFVSILAHDLRGPLMAAKLSAHLLRQHPERLEERRDWR